MFKEIWFSPVKRRILLIGILLAYVLFLFSNVLSSAFAVILTIGFVVLLAMFMPGKPGYFFLRHAKAFHSKGRYRDAYKMYEKALPYQNKPEDQIKKSIIKTFMASCLREMSKTDKDASLLEKAILLNEEVLQEFYEYSGDYIDILKLVSEDYLKLSEYRDKVHNVQKSIECLDRITYYLDNSAKFGVVDSLFLSMMNNTEKAAKYLLLKEITGCEDGIPDLRELLDYALRQGNLLMDRLDPNEHRVLKSYTLKNMADIHFKVYEITKENEYAEKALEELRKSIENMGTDRNLIRNYRDLYTDISKKTAVIESAVNGNVSASNNINCIVCKRDFSTEDCFPICKDCHSKLFHYPIPVGIKVLSVAVLGILIYSLIQFPSAMGGGISYEKALKAEKQHRYYTASVEYEKALKSFPDSLLIQSRLFIAYVKEDNINKVKEVYDKLLNRDYRDNKLYREVNSALDRVDSAYKVDKELEQILNNYESLDSGKRINELSEYIKKSGGSTLAFLYLGNEYYDQKSYDKALEIYKKALDKSPNHSGMKLNIAAVYRQKKDYDKAIETCNEVLKDNEEYSSAYASLAKIELARKDYKKALEIIKKAYGLYWDDANLLGAASVVYHYNKMLKERDEAFTKLEAADKEYAQEIKAVFEGTRTYPY